MGRILHRLHNLGRLALLAPLTLLALLVLAGGARSNVIYLREEASDLDLAGILDKSTAFTRGDGLYELPTNLNLDAAPVPVHATQTGGDHVVFWTPQLDAVTLSGTVTAHLWGHESGTNANCGFKVEIRRCAADGTYISWPFTYTSSTELTTSPAAYDIGGTFTTVSLTEGQRLRIDIYGAAVGGSLGTTRNFTLDYHAGFADVEGDSYITFGQTLVEHTPPAADHMDITTAIPQSGEDANVAFTTQPTVQTQDASHAAQNYTGTVTASIQSGPSGAQLIGTAAQNYANESSKAWTNLGVDTAGTYTLRFTANPSLGASSTVDEANIVVDGPSHMDVTRQPTGFSGSPFTTQPQVQVQTAAHAGWTGNYTITASKVSGPGNLTGTLSASVTGGNTVTWSNLGVDAAGTYTIRFTLDTRTPALATGSETVDVVGLVVDAPETTADHLNVTTSIPLSGEDANVAFTTQPSITIHDENSAPKAWTGTVTASIQSGPSGSQLIGTAAQSYTDESQKTWTNLGVDTAGTYTIRFTASPALAAASTVDIASVVVDGPTHADVTVAPVAPAGGGTFTTQPQVQFQTAAHSGWSANYSVTASKVGGPGNLTGTLTASVASGHTVVFSDLGVDAPGHYTLRFTLTTRTPALPSGSQTVDVEIDAPLVVNVYPTLTGGTLTFTFPNGTAPVGNSVEYRPTPGSGVWRAWQPLQTVVAGWSETADDRMAVAFWGMDEGAAFEYRLTLTGADYPVTQTGTITTLDSTPNTGGGATIDVAPSDLTPTDYHSLYAYLYARLSHDNGGNPGVTVRMRQGTYRQALGDATYMWRFSGGEANPLLFTNYPGEHVVFEGSNPRWDRAASEYNKGEDAFRLVGTAAEVLGGYAQLEAPVGSNITASDRIYRSYDRYYNAASPDYTEGAMDDPPMPRYMWYERQKGGDAWQLLNVTVGQTWNVYAPDGVVGGGGKQSEGPKTLGDRVRYVDATGRIDGKYWGAFSCDDGYLYVHLHADMETGVVPDPDTMWMKIPYIQNPIRVGLSGAGYDGIVFDGANAGGSITFKYYGYYAGLNAGSAGSAGFGLTSSSHVTIKNFRFQGMSAVLYQCQSGTVTHAIVWKNNTIWNRGTYPEWSASAGYYRPTAAWAHCKFSIHEQNATGLLTSNSYSLVDNTYHGVTNGVVFANNSDRTRNIGVEVIGNTIYGTADDGVEPEYWVVGGVIAGNTLSQFYKGISTAPLTGGPLYIVRNTFYSDGSYRDFTGAAGGIASAFKIGNSSSNHSDTGYKLYANNTVIQNSLWGSTAGLSGINNQGRAGNLFFFNNYLSCDALPIDLNNAGGIQYPTIFNNNVYRHRYPLTKPEGYTMGGSWNFVSEVATFQGETTNNQPGRRLASFSNWQTGYNELRTSGANPLDWPGYDGTVREEAEVTDLSHTPTSTAWVHDPDSAYYQNVSHDLTDPRNGDFRPRPGSSAVGAGKVLEGITRNNPARFAAYDEASPTVGARLPAATPAGPELVAIYYPWFRDPIANDTSWDQWGDHTVDPHHNQRDDTVDAVTGLTKGALAFRSDFRKLMEVSPTGKVTVAYAWWSLPTDYSNEATYGVYHRDTNPDAYEQSADALVHALEALQKMKGDGEPYPRLAVHAELHGYDINWDAAQSRLFFQNALFRFYDMVTAADPDLLATVLDGATTRPLVTFWQVNSSGSYTAFYTDFKAAFATRYTTQQPYLLGCGNAQDANDWPRYSVPCFAMPTWDPSLSTVYSHADEHNSTGVLAVGGSFNRGTFGKRIQAVRHKTEDAYMLRWQLERALRATPNILVLWTWNDHQEGTALEDTEEYGSAYRELLKDLVGVVRAGGTPALTANANPNRAYWRPYPESEAGPVAATSLTAGADLDDTGDDFTDGMVFRESLSSTETYRAAFNADGTPVPNNVGFHTITPHAPTVSPPSGVMHKTSDYVYGDHVQGFVHMDVDDAFAWYPLPAYYASPVKVRVLYYNSIYRSVPGTPEPDITLKAQYYSTTGGSDTAYTNWFTLASSSTVTISGTASVWDANNDPGNRWAWAEFTLDNPVLCNQLGGLYGDPVDASDFRLHIDNGSLWIARVEVLLPDEAPSYAPLAVGSEAATSDTFTSNYTIPIADLDEGFTLMVHLRTRLFDAEGTYDILRLEDAGGAPLFGLAHSNSPYKAAYLKNHAGTFVAGNNGVSNFGVIDQGGGTGNWYETMTFVYKPATALADGYFRGYLSDRIPPGYAAYNGRLLDYRIAAGTAPALGFTDALRLVVGNANDPYQHMEVSEIALWGEVLDTNPVYPDLVWGGYTGWGEWVTHNGWYTQRITAPPLLKLSDVALASLLPDARHDGDLLVWVRGNAKRYVDTGTVVNDASGARALSSFALTPNSLARLDAGAAPVWSNEYGPQAETTGPTIATQPTVASVVNHTVTVSVPDMGTDASGMLTVYATLGVHTDDHFSWMDRVVVSANQAVLTAPSDGQHLSVRVHFVDKLDNQTIVTLPVEIGGNLPWPAFPVNVYEAGGAGTGAWATRSAPVDMDLDTGFTVAFYTKGDASDTATDRLLFHLDDDLTEADGYNYFFLYRNSMSVNDGMHATGITLSENLYSTDWVHVVASVQFPTASAAGALRCWKNGVSVANYALPAVDWWEDDYHYRKFLPKFKWPYGGTGVKYYMSDVGFWSGFIADQAFVDGIYGKRLAWMQDGHGVGEAARHDDKLVALWDGAIDGTPALVPSAGSLVHAKVNERNRLDWDGTCPVVSSGYVTTAAVTRFTYTNLEPATDDPAVVTFNTDRQPWNATATVRITATDSDGTIEALSATMLDEDGLTFANFTGTPVGLGTSTAYVDITWSTGGGHDPGDWTLTGHATDSSDNVTDTAETVRVRRRSIMTITGGS